jgi:hypothetical protein
MNHKCNLKIYAICGVSLLTTIAIFSISVAAIENEPEQYHQGVEILSLEVYEFPPLFYDIDWWIYNYNDYDVTVEIEQSVMYPNGGSTTLFLTETILANDGLGIGFLYMYPSPLLYGTYTCVLTIRDTHGEILDQDSVSWIREFSMPQIPL